MPVLPMSVMMINADIIFVTTGSNASLLQNLISSIEGRTNGLKVYLVLVNQGSKILFKNEDPLLQIHTIDVGKQMSLSASRNLALKFLFDQKVSAQHIMFPDDDTSFKKDFFEIYFNLEPQSAYLAKICNEEDGADYRNYPDKSRCGKESLIPWVASVSLLIPYTIAKKIGHFDPKLGVGAKWGSSEDLDYFLRATQHLEFCFLPELKNYHPSRFGKYEKMSSENIRKRFKAYTDGYLLVYFRYNLESKLGLFATRALGGAMISILRLNFRLSFQYLWLYQYRRKAKSYFSNLKREEPDKISLEYDF
ncbi:MAG: hypothetical protein NXI09_12975 [Bacteroidetes bacterium]|nr:hypothetical protein [Bacteroidota bacterium]